MLHHGTEKYQSAESSCSLKDRVMNGGKTVMDVLNLWKDDPEELLFELGFGRDEPDLSGRIPARFINFQSQARGISLQVFLGAQKNRLDLENPDVSNRFRELEVLQHVTTKFCSLVVSSSSSSLRAPVERRLSPEARERRRRIGLRFRQASKKSLCQTHNNKTQEISTPSSTCAQYTAPESLQPPPSLGEEKATLERVKPGLLADGQGAGLNPQLQPHMVSFNGQERALSPGHLTEGPPLTANTFLERKKSREQANELFEMEEALPDPSGRNPGSQRSEMPDSPSSRSQHNSSAHPLSPSLISSGGEKYHLSSPCPFPEPSKYDTPCSEIEIPSLQVLSSLASSSRLEYLELHHRTRSQSPTLTSAALCISVSPTASFTQADSEDKDAPYPYLSTLPQDLQDIACPTMTSVPPSPSPNLDCPPSTLIAVSSTRSDFSFGSPGSTKSEWTEVLHENSLAVSGSLSSLLPVALHDFHCPSYFDSSQLTESFSQSPENESKDSVFSHSDGIGLSEEPTNTQKEQDETSLSLSFQLEKEEDNSSHPSLSFLDSFKFELSHLSRETFFPVCLSALSSQSHPHTDLIDSAPVRESVLREQSIAQQGQSSSHDDNTDFIPSSTVQDVIYVKMDQLSLDTEGSPQRRRKGEGETHTDTVQTQDTADKESSADMTEGFELASEELCNQTVMDPQVLSHSLCDEFSAETKPEELSEEINGTESESPRSYFVLNKLPELQRRTEVEPKDLIETEDLDLVFETSVDSLDGETVDVDNFFQQLETEGRVYWAEPIQVLNPTHELSGSSSSEVESPENSSWHIGSAALDSTSSTVKALSLPFLSSATTSTDQNPEITTTASSDTPPSLAVAPFVSLPANSDLKLLSRSVSVQLSSSLSSHIVQRKDVPYVDDSKHTSPLPSVFPLDTSNPFRAVQVWTDVQIQRNIQKLSRQATHTVPREATTSEMTQRSTLTFSSSQSFPLMSTDSQSFDISPGMTKDYRTVSASVDTALWSDKEEEVDRNGNKHKENLWEGNQSVSMACWSSCDDHCTCCTQNTYHNQHSPFSLGDLEELMLCLQHFRSVHSNMEEQLSEDQASVYSSLSDQDREKIQDLEVLRGAVKQEAAELETHLNQLTHHCGDSLKTKMQRLLEEQSLLCSQLFLPGAVRTSSGLTPNRTVSTQCCLLPWTSADVQSDHISSCSTWNENSPRQSPSGSESSCKGLGSFSEPM